MRGLGRTYDVSISQAPVDQSGGATTGKRVSLAEARHVDLLIVKAAEATGTDDPVLTIQQHKVNTSGTPANLATIDHYWKKSQTTMDGTETWTYVSQAASQTVTLTGEATKQGLYVIEIEADDLTDGYHYVSANIADAGSTAQLLGSVWVLGQLAVERKPSNMRAGLHA